MWCGKIKNIRIVKRSEINELPKADESQYYKFEIEEWCKLENKIEISSYQIRNFIYTTLYLLNNARNVTELCIKTKEEFRIFNELKRFYDEAVIETDNDIESEISIKVFNINDINIIIKDENNISDMNEKVISISKNEFMKKTIKNIKKLLQE